jgi:hypothetical protein
VCVRVCVRVARTADSHRLSWLLGWHCLRYHMMLAKFFILKRIYLFLLSEIFRF